MAPTNSPVGRNLPQRRHPVDDMWHQALDQEPSATFNILQIWQLHMRTDLRLRIGQFLRRLSFVMSFQEPVYLSEIRESSPTGSWPNSSAYPVGLLSVGLHWKRLQTLIVSKWYNVLFQAIESERIILRCDFQLQKRHFKLGPRHSSC